MNISEKPFLTFRRGAFLCFCMFLFYQPGISQDTNSPVDPEEIAVYEGLMEDMEIRNQSKLELHSRFRMLPADIEDKWHHRMMVNTGAWNTGYRIDKLSDDQQWQVSRYYLMRRIGEVFLTAGHLKLRLGQGLVFSSEYGRTKSPGQMIRLAKSDYTGGYHLGAATYDEMEGVLSKFRFGTTTHIITTGRINNSPLFAYSGKRENPGGHMGIVIAGRYDDGNIPSAVSIFFDESVSGITFSGELGISQDSRSYILNIYHQEPRVNWLIQRRYFSPQWKPFAGSPLSRFHDGANESAWLFSAGYKAGPFILRSWLEVAEEQSGSDTHLPNEGTDWLLDLGYSSQSGRQVTIRFRIKSRFIEQTVETEGPAVTILGKEVRNHLSISYRTKYRWFLRFQWLKLKDETPNEGYGWLMTLRSPSVEYGKFTGSGGLHLFHTDNWNTRIYDYVPGLPGEFRFYAYYSTGAEFFSKWSYELSEQTYVSFRYSFLWKNMTYLTKQSDFLIQVETGI